MINKISEIELKSSKGTMDLWDGKSSMKILIKYSYVITLCNLSSAFLKVEVHSYYIILYHII